MQSRACGPAQAAVWIGQLLLVPWVLGADPAAPVPRSLPPKQWDADTISRFPDDPLGRLKGPRPAPASPVKPPQEAGPGSSEPTAGGKFAWSKIISASTVENEIKSNRTGVADAVKNIGVFKAGGSRQLRRQFSVLAAMFGIAAEYDQSIRWKSSAAGARDAFARAATNAKAADDNTFNESKLRSRDLEDLVRGSTVQLPTAGAEVQWDQIAERRQLMARLEQAFEKRLRKIAANEAEFGRGRDQAVHEAEIVAAIAEIVGRESYESADDADYRRIALALRRQAQTAAAAAREKNFAELQRAVGEMSKSCSACHEHFK